MSAEFIVNFTSGNLAGDDIIYHSNLYLFNSSVEFYHKECLL